MMTDIVCGMSSAAPSPWKARAVMTSPAVCDSPQVSDAKVKTATPVADLFDLAFYNRVAK